MQITDKQLEAVTLSEAQKLEVFRATLSNTMMDPQKDAEEKIKTLKIIEIQGGRGGVLKRFWRWAWG